MDASKAVSADAAPPDADLVGLCRQMADLNRLIRGLDARGVSPRDVGAYNAYQRQWLALADQAARIPARTLAGVRARVAAMGRLVPDTLHDGSCTERAERALVEALIGDITAP